MTVNHKYEELERLESQRGATAQKFVWRRALLDSWLLWTLVASCAGTVTGILSIKIHSFYLGVVTLVFLAPISINLLIFFGFCIWALGDGFCKHARETWWTR